MYIHRTSTVFVYTKLCKQCKHVPLFTFSLVGAKPQAPYYINKLMATRYKKIYIAYKEMMKTFKINLSMMKKIKKNKMNFHR